MKKFITIATAIILAVSMTQMFSQVHQRAEVKPEVVFAYNKWVQKHGKLYATPEEANYRLQVFSENYATIMKHRENPVRSYELGLTIFADITDEEFIAAYGAPVEDVERIVAERKEKIKKQREESAKNGQVNVEPIQKRVGQVPTKIDWREKGVVPPVRAQNSQCPRSGGAYTAASSATAQYRINKQHSAKSVNQGVTDVWSVQRLLDCPLPAYKCGNFYFANDAFKLLIVSAITPQKYYNDYTGIPQECRTSERNLQYRTYRYLEDNTDNGQQTLTLGNVTSNLSYWPASIKLYTSGVYTATECATGQSPTFYEPIVVGFDSNPSSTVEGSVNQQPINKPYYITQWAFGTSWGENGYLRVEKVNGSSGTGSCKLIEFTSYIVPYDN